MKKEYPFYKSWENGKRLNLSKKVKLNPKDKELLSEFLMFHSITSKGKKRADDIKVCIIQLRDFLEKPLDKIEDKDFFYFAEAINRSDRKISGKNNVKGNIKKFGLWLSEKTGKQFKSLKLIKSEVLNGSPTIKSPKDLITELEFDRMIRATQNLMHKTLICLLWESAGRPEEILKSRFSDIDFTGKTLKLHSGKTKRMRVVPLDVSLNHLKRLKEETNANDADLIFTSLKQGKQLSNASFNFIVQRIGKKAGIKRTLSGYSFRHTRLTKLIKTLSPKSYEMFSGHSLETGMKTYAHLSVDDLTKEMQEKIFGVKPLTSEEKDKLKSMEKKLAEFEELLKTQLSFNQEIQNELIHAKEKSSIEMLNVLKNLNQKLSPKTMSFSKHNIS